MIHTTIFADSLPSCKTQQSTPHTNNNNFGLTIVLFFNFQLLIPVLAVEKITKEKTARIIPNAVGIATSEDKHVFGSLMSRDSTYRYMNKILDAARTASQIPDEPEILVSVHFLKAKRRELSCVWRGPVSGTIAGCRSACSLLG